MSYGLNLRYIFYISWESSFVPCLNFTLIVPSKKKKKATLLSWLWDFEYENVYQPRAEKPWIYKLMSQSWLSLGSLASNISDQKPKKPILLPASRVST